MTHSPEFRGSFFLRWRRSLRLLRKKPRIDHEERLCSPAVYVSRHQNQYAPDTMLLWFPEPAHIWAYYPFTEKQACYDHFLNFTLTERLGWNRVFASVVARLGAAFVPKILKSAGAIAVYRDRRAIRTLRESARVMKNGESVLLFADRDYQKTEGEVQSLYTGFLRIERFFRRAMGQSVPFIPLRLDRKENVLYVGEPVLFDPDADFKSELERVGELLRGQL